MSHLPPESAVADGERSKTKEPLHPPREPVDPDPTPTSGKESWWRSKWRRNHASASSAAQIIYSGLTFLLLLAVAYQGYTGKEQYRLDRDVWRRAFTRQLLGDIYAGGGVHERLREDAVRAYLREVRRGRDNKVRDGRRFRDGEFEECDESRPKPQLGRAPLQGTTFKDSIFKDVDNLACIDFAGADFSGAVLVNIHLEGSTFTSSKFHLADLRGAFLDEADLTGAELFGTVLSGTWLVDANLSGAKLVPPEEGVDFGVNTPQEGVKLQGAYLAGADFGGVSFCNVDLRGVDLSQVRNLRQELLQGAIMDGTTELPVRLKPTARGAPCVRQSDARP